MDADDLEPRHKKLPPVDLDVMSMEALGEYIVGLEHEIERASAAIATKKKAQAGADAFFKS